MKWLKLCLFLLFWTAQCCPMNVAKRQKYGQRFEWKIVKKSLWERSNSRSCFRRGEGGQQFVTANTKKNKYFIQKGSKGVSFIAKNSLSYFLDAAWTVSQCKWWQTALKSSKTWQCISISAPSTLVTSKSMCFSVLFLQRCLKHLKSVLFGTRTTHTLKRSRISWKLNLKDHF